MELLCKDNQFLSIDLLETFYPQPTWNLTPYQYVMIMGLQRYLLIRKCQIVKKYFTFILINPSFWHIIMVRK